MSYVENWYLVSKHKKWLHMIKWSDLPDNDFVFVQADHYSKNHSIHHNDGTECPSPHNIYVNGNLTADIRHRIPYALSAAVEAIFVTMGLPKLMLHPWVVALDKWLMLEVHTIQIILDLL